MMLQLFWDDGHGCFTSIKSFYEAKHSQVTSLKQKMSEEMENSTEQLNMQSCD